MNLFLRQIYRLRVSEDTIQFLILCMPVCTDDISFIFCLNAFYVLCSARLIRLLLKGAVYKDKTKLPKDKSSTLCAQFPPRLWLW